MPDEENMVTPEPLGGQEPAPAEGQISGSADTQAELKEWQDSQSRGPAAPFPVAKVAGAALALIVIGGGATFLIKSLLGHTTSPEEATKTQMRIVAESANAYARYHGNEFPYEMDAAFKSYFPGGGNDGKTPASEGPVNPFSGKAEWPVQGASNSIKEACKSKEPLHEGQIEYNPVENTTGRAVGYIIRAGGPDGDPLTDKGQVFLITNNSP